jgi:hypothetical protein
MLNDLVTITTIIANCAVVIGVIIAVLQLRKMRISNELQQRAIIADHERRKKQSTIEFAHQILEERTIATSKINAAFPNGKVINVVDTEYSGDVKKAVTRYLNLMERFSVGINIGVYDIDVFMRITGFATIAFYKRLEPVILEGRRSSGRTTRYADFEELVDKMNGKYKKSQPLILDNSAKIINS